MTIMLRDILPIAEPKEYKVHFAKRGSTGQPLDVFTKDRREWQGWQEYRPVRDAFNRPLIFSLANFYHEPETWLFGGIFRVLARNKKGYKVVLTEIADGFIGRLKLHSPYNSRSVRVNMESHYDEFEVTEILKEPFSGRPFPGYEDIELSFEEIETLVRNERPDWKAALGSVKGIYLITDKSTGKRYVGKASGEGGIWSRWCNYAVTGHGGNKELRALKANADLDYYRANFRFALLEHRPFRVADELIIERENFWKHLLLTRGDQGLNRN
ncbi:MAG: GIY-YIG nuclease family protein [Acidobacteriaceae bacterium]